MRSLASAFFFFFFNDTATTEIYTLSLHDALPISAGGLAASAHAPGDEGGRDRRHVGRSHVARHGAADRKSTRLNSSHANISYAVFCLKKKKTSIPLSLICTTHIDTRTRALSVYAL